MNDDDRRESGRLMLISPERVFYAGLLGRPRKRTSGGFSIYAAMQGSLKITEGKLETISEVRVVPPYVTHSVESEYPSIICLVIEPETVEPTALVALGARVSGTESPDIAQRIRAAYETLRCQRRRGGFTTADFDRLVFGEELPDRNIDLRIRRAALSLNDFSGSKMTAADCAASVNLSPSRFLHLFKEQTGVSFRAFRAWKRARHLLHFVNEDINRPISRRISATPTRRISAIRSAGSTDCSRARFSRVHGIWRFTGAIRACSTMPASVKGGCNRGPVAAGSAWTQEAGTGGTHDPQE